MFVCTGNICRSPFAEALWQQISPMPCASAGFGAGRGALANDRARLVARAWGIDLDPHSARHVADMVWTDADLVVGFDSAHLKSLQRLRATYSVQITMLGLWCAPRNGSIHDPFGLDEATFHFCFSRVAQGIRELDNYLSENLYQETAIDHAEWRVARSAPGRPK